ncbi:vitamin K epoxide reductase family protein [uncultured Bacteroides sp.]|uniref:vitamin K epoxide reductase family protein n=1 Tax=uncultured Bacteroides sp. TaxID=162156 RepID=UPI00258CA851|nr:vitamin K epoxide reductase family protein [uncultured Bacteroides sp.]
MLGVDNATSEVVHHFLRSLTVKVSRTTLCRLLDNPLGNTMQGISNALNALHVKNVVYQLQPRHLEKLHAPFITQLETSHSTFCLVEKIEQDRLIISTAEVSHMPISRKLFTYQWTGTVLFGETTPKTVCESHCLLRNMNYICRQHRILIAGIISVLLVFSSIWSKNYPAGLPLYLSALTCGILISTVILYKEMVDKHFLHRFCHIGKVIDCNEVLKSKGAHIAGIGIGELSWMYFTTMFFFTAVCPEEFHFLAALFGFIAIAFTLYSIIYQIFIIRKACLFCILTIFSVWLTAASLYVIRNNFEWRFSIRILFSMIAISTICLIFWIQAKTLVSSDKEKSFLQAKLSGLLNPITFQKLLALKPKVRRMIHPDIALHNSAGNAKDRLMVVVNPNCKACAKVHRHIREISRDISISLVIYTNDRLGIHIAQTILSAYLSEGWDRATYLLEAWFEMQEIPDVERYNINDTAQLLWRQQQEYCLQNNVSHTPAVIVNGHYIPSVYQLAELKYVLA